MQCLYIHGFRSAPISTKAEMTRSWFEETFGQGSFHAPDVNCPPSKAIQLLENAYTQHLSVVPASERVIIGSSLGGFYATHLANRFESRAVLINPACYPHQRLHEFIGEHDNFYTQEKIRVDAEFLGQLESLFQPTLHHPERFLVLLETGDEVLNYKEAAERFSQSHLIVKGGGDHSYTDYAKRWPSIQNFLAKPYI